MRIRSGARGDGRGVALTHATGAVVIFNVTFPLALPFLLAPLPLSLFLLVLVLLLALLLVLLLASPPVILPLLILPLPIPAAAISQYCLLLRKGIAFREARNFQEGPRRNTRGQTKEGGGGGKKSEGENLAAGGREGRRGREPGQAGPS